MTSKQRQYGKKLATLTFLNLHLTIGTAFDFNAACFEILKSHTATPAYICELVRLQVIMALVSLKLLKTSIVVPGKAVPKLGLSIQVQ